MFFKKFKIEKILLNLSILFALFGGALLLLILILTFISIFGRVFFLKPILGYYEIIELISACVIFSFLPICQIKKGNLVLDYFTSGLNLNIKIFMDIVSYIILTLVYIFFTFYMLLGAIDIFNFNEQTMLLRIPIWIGFVPSILAFLLLSLICIYSFITSLTNIIGIKNL